MESYAFLRTYEDVDELTAEARDWDLDLVPTESGNFRSTVLQARCGAVQVARARFRGALIQSGAPPAGCWTFVVPASPSTGFLWRGHRVTGDSILVFPLAAELHAASGPDFHVFTVSIEADHLQAVAESLHLPSPVRLVGTTEVFAAAPGRLARLRIVLGETSGAVAAGLSPDALRLTEVLLRELPALLLSGIAEASDRAPAVAPSRLDLVRSVEARIARKPELASASVPLLAALCGASGRTLRRAFAETYGCGPKEYLLAQRYNEVRRLLRDADPSWGAVSALAGRHGFWHRGSFAAEYRRRFGEFPSQTLERRDG